MSELNQTVNCEMSMYVLGKGVIILNNKDLYKIEHCMV